MNDSERAHAQVEGMRVGVSIPFAHPAADAVLWAIARSLDSGDVLEVRQNLQGNRITTRRVRRPLRD